MEPAGGQQEFEDFIYLISHDVRNSVRALLELPVWIEEDLASAGYELPDSITENISLLGTHTRRLDRMLTDLLVYSRIGRMQSGSLLSWDNVIDSVLDQIQIPSRFRIVRNIQSPMIYLGDTDVMTLASALISNCVKHHDRDVGTIWISTEETPECQILTVSDDGPGIPGKYGEKVFDLMTTLKPRDSVEGSGMGLANVRKIAAIYGGRVEMAKQVGNRGCSFKVRFPKSGNPEFLTQSQTH